MLVYDGNEWNVINWIAIFTNDPWRVAIFIVLRNNYKMA